ncbi:MAG: hypothetical protein MZV65_14830 [Chromatiales bacterium]|nr:hypothetical protein [Chromatiales bacterium]
MVEWAVPAMLPDAERHGADGILFLDEITSAPPAVSAAAYQLILDRRLGEYRVPDGLGDLRRRQPPGRPRRDLQHAGAARQPLLALRGRGASRRLGGVGLCQRHRRAR